MLNGRDKKGAVFGDNRVSIAKDGDCSTQERCFLLKQKTRVHILTRMSKYEQDGSWNNDADNAARAYRDNNNPDNRNDNLDFRS